MFILLMCLASLALAEPPVGDSYLEAAQSVHNHGTDQHHYLSTDLSVPPARSFSPVNTLNDKYTKSNPGSISQEYGAPDFRSELSQEHGTPNSRSFAKNFGNIPLGNNAPASRSSLSFESHTANLGQSFPSTNSKNSISRNYGAPTSRNLPSNVYGVPSQRSPSQQYSVPETRTAFEEHGTAANGNTFARQNPAPIQKYGLPKSSSNARHVTQKHDDLSLKSNLYTSLNLPSSLSSNRGFPARSSLVQFGVPESRNADKYSEQPSRSYGVPNGRSSSQEYSDSEFATTGSKTQSYSSSIPSIRSPSQEYGAPSSRNAMPSQEYGVPYDASSDQAYEYARNALELLNQEPANYEFSYKVNDYQSGSDFGHVESRDEDRAEGSYFVVLPDGSKQIVEYEADENGFKPRITVEPADSATSFAADGPY